MLPAMPSATAKLKLHWVTSTATRDSGAAAGRACVERHTTTAMIFSSISASNAMPIVPQRLPRRRGADSGGSDIVDAATAEMEMRKLPAGNRVCPRPRSFAALDDGRRYQMSIGRVGAAFIAAPRRREEGDMILAYVCPEVLLSMTWLCNCSAAWSRSRSAFTPRVLAAACLARRVSARSMAIAGCHMLTSPPAMASRAFRAHFAFRQHGRSHAASARPYASWSAGGFLAA